MKIFFLTLREMRLYKLFLLLFLTISTSAAYSQSSYALKKKKQALQREINLLQQNANKAAKNKQLTLTQINALSAKINLMQDKITVINSEIKNLDEEINENTHTVQNLKGQLNQLKASYAGMMRFAQRNQNAYNKMMFIFSSGSFNQAYKRMKYLQQFSQYRMKQADYISGKQKDLKYKIVILDKSLKEKSSLAQEQEQEKSKLGESKSQQSAILNKYSKQETRYKQDIEVRKKKQAKLDRDIRDAIARDIALAKKRELEAARAAAAKLAAARAAAARRAEALAKSRALAGKKAVPVVAEKEEPPVAAVKTTGNYLTATPESAKLSSAFESNRGSLPWPVSSGAIIERFGRHKEGEAYYTNDGINIETAAGAAVRAVFNGTVSIVSNQYGRYFVLIKHGGYYTVYQNLSSVNVASGQTVTTRQTIGVVASEDGRPQLQFQIRRGTAPQNPEAWISK